MAQVRAGIGLELCRRPHTDPRRLGPAAVLSFFVSLVVSQATVTAVTPETSAVVAVMLQTNFRIASAAREE